MSTVVYPYLVRYQDYTLDSILLSAEDGRRLLKELEEKAHETEVYRLSTVPKFSLNQSILFGRI